VKYVNGEWVPSAASNRGREIIWTDARIAGLLEDMHAAGKTISMKSLRESGASGGRGRLAAIIREFRSTHRLTRKGERESATDQEIADCCAEIRTETGREPSIGQLRKRKIRGASSRLNRIIAETGGRPAPTLKPNTPHDLPVACITCRIRIANHLKGQQLRQGDKVRGGCHYDQLPPGRIAENSAIYQPDEPFRMQ
jgi:hypothetical protein